MTNGYQQFFKKAKAVAAEDDNAGSTPLGRVIRKASRKTQFNLNSNPNQKPANKQQATQQQRTHGTMTSKEMAESLRRRLKARPARARRKVQTKMIMTSLLGLIITVGLIYKADMVEGFTKKIEFSLMGYAGAEEAKPEAKPIAAADAADKGKAGKPADKTAVAAAAPVVEKREFSEDEISHFSKLNERKRELDAREEELNRMEQELAQQKVELEKRLKDLDSTRRQISSVLEEKVQGDDKKIESLVQVYSNMKPQQAAKIFETMDEDLAIEILGRMKKKPAAEILNLVKPEKAQILSEKYAGYKQK
jgi:flagellar motility protein MotE (MotC chaperone)